MAPIEPEAQASGVPRLRFGLRRSVKQKTLVSILYALWIQNGRLGSAREALHQANGSLKLAFLILEGCDLDEATRILDRAGGQLRAAKALIDTHGVSQNRNRRT